MVVISSEVEKSPCYGMSRLRFATLDMTCLLTLHKKQQHNIKHNNEPEGA